MKFLQILCLSSLFLCAKCGLIKNFLGSVREEVHKLTEGNVVVNTVHEIVEVKKDMISDLSNIINPNNYLKPNNNDQSNKNTPQQVQPHNSDNNDILLSVSKPTINLNEIIPSVNTKPLPGNVPIPEYSVINSNSNKEDHIIQTSTELIKPIFFNENASNIDINEYEFGIEPRIARQISPYDLEDTTLKQRDSDKLDVEETNPNQNETIIDGKNIDINRENENIMINFDPPLNNSSVIVTEVVNGCPEGFEIAADGSCNMSFDLNPGNDTKSEGTNRANFVGGCFEGYAHAADGSCQEIIYD
ncbi:uncharacterized protein LOC123876910 [Maniola jurtina]|uniref:uncharacterized protein LOC123876910 n=1 Tax=Maniola jurtina TaxID=191418 RepID=UPI001E68D471|nr:uncharacterized protein LOC123876910 [Maniola jurtina]